MSDMTEEWAKEAVKILRQNGSTEAADAVESLRSRLAEAERNEETLLGMIRHQQDVLRECLPYVNESMAGRRPGRSADDIRAAVKALTTDSASVKCRKCGAIDPDYVRDCKALNGDVCAADQPGEAGK